MSKDDYTKDHVIPKDVLAISSEKEIPGLTATDRALFRQFAFQPMHKECNRDKDAWFPPIAFGETVVASKCTCCSWVFTEEDGSIFNGAFFNGKRVNLLRQYEGGEASVKPCQAVFGQVSPIGDCDDSIKEEVAKHVDPAALILKFKDRKGRLVFGVHPPRLGGLVTADVIAKTNRSYPGCRQCGGNLSVCVRCGTSRVKSAKFASKIKREMMTVGNMEKWQRILYPPSDS